MKKNAAFRLMVFPLLFLVTALAGTALAQRSSPLVADHTHTDLGQISASCVDQAKTLFRMSYGHTSHGSQIITGMNLLMARDAFYSWNHDGTGGALSLWDTTPGGDLGNPDRVTWAQLTRDMLDTPGCDRNLVVWSWCGQASTSNPADIDTYLGLMSQLEIDYPDVTFVYMTGHLDGSGETGYLNQRNNQIRDFVNANNKVLFDFADIESYDPAGNYYVDRGANDNCDYDTGNWAQEWCAAHPADCEACGCAHSQCLNCQRKGRVFWWLLATLACGPQTPCDTPVVSLNGVRAGDDVSLAWSTVGSAVGYNVWSAHLEEEIDLARLGHGEAHGVAGCSPPTPAASPSCRDMGGVSREAPTLFYYQVRAVCAGNVEGP